MFPRAQSHRREVEDAAAEAMPIVREQLAAAASRVAPKSKLVLRIGLPSIGYDVRAGALRFARGAHEMPRVVPSETAFLGTLELMNRVRGAVYGTKRRRGERDLYLLPAEARGGQAYHLPEASSAPASPTTISWATC